MATSQLIAQLLEHYSRIKTHHWFSSNYQQHIILDDYTEEYLELYDTLAEYFIEQHGDIDAGVMVLTVKAKPGYAVIDTINVIKEHQGDLRLLKEAYPNDSIISLIDDIIILQDQTIYRLRKTFV